MASQCPGCGYTHDECQHKDTRKEKGDFGRRPDAFEVCNECGIWWTLDWEGRRDRKLGRLNVTTGEFSL
jgi:hypothetical protein